MCLLDFALQAVPAKFSVLVCVGLDESIPSLLADG